MSRRREAAELAKALRLSTQTAPVLTFPNPSKSAFETPETPLPPLHQYKLLLNRENEDKAIGINVKPLTPSTTPIGGPTSSISFLPGKPIGRSSDQIPIRVDMPADPRTKEDEEMDEDDENAIVADSQEDTGVVARVGDVDEDDDEDSDEDGEVPESENENDGMMRGVQEGEAGGGLVAMGMGMVMGGLDLRILSDVPAKQQAEPNEAAIPAFPSIPSHSTIQTFTPSSNAPQAPEPEQLNTDTSTTITTNSDDLHQTHTRAPIPIELPIPGSSTHRHHVGSSGLDSGSGLSESASTSGSGSCGGKGSVAGSGSSGKPIDPSRSNGSSTDAQTKPDPNGARPKPRPRIKITSDARAMAESHDMPTSSGYDHLLSSGMGGENVATYTATTNQSSRDVTGTRQGGEILNSSLNTVDLPATAISAPTGVGFASGGVEEDKDDGDNADAQTGMVTKPKEKKKVVATYGSKGKGKADPSGDGKAPLPQKRKLLATQEAVTSDSDEGEDSRPEVGPSKVRKTTTSNGRTTRARSTSMPAPSVDTTTTSKSKSSKAAALPSRGRSRTRDVSPDPLDGLGNGSDGDDSDDEFGDYPVAKKPAMAGKQTGRAGLGGKRSGKMELEIEVPTSKRKVEVVDEPKRNSKKRRVASSSPSGSESGGGSDQVKKQESAGSLPATNEVIDIDEEPGPVAGPSTLKKTGSERQSATAQLEEDDFAPEPVPVDADDDEDDFVPDAPAKKKKAAGKSKAAPKKASVASKAKGGKKGAKATKAEAASNAIVAETEDVSGQANASATSSAAKKGNARSVKSQTMDKSTERVQESDVEMEEPNAKSETAKEAAPVAFSRASTSPAKTKLKLTSKGKKSVVESDVDMEVGDAESSRGSASPVKAAGKTAIDAKKSNKRVAESDAESESRASPAVATAVKGKGKAKNIPEEDESAEENVGRAQKIPRDNSPAVLQPRAAFKLNQVERPASPSVVVDKFGNVKQFKTDRTDLPRVVSSTGGVKRMGMSRKNHIPSLHRNIQPPPKKLAAAPKKPEKQLKEGNYGSDEEPMDAFGRPIIGPDHPDYWKQED